MINRREDVNVIEPIYDEYRTKRLLNVHRHVDGPWFWTRYSARPYVGCRSGCTFCYFRGRRYLGRRDPNSFDSLIQIKTNAPELLRKELSRVEKDVISCGDWQRPAEERYRLSRQMLEVVREFGFPTFIVERSPLVVRDVDLLADINSRSWVAVAMSISNLDTVLKNALEPNSPGVRERLKAMQQIAHAGVLTGTTLMPVIPVIGDDPAVLEDVVVATKDHGGSFVLAGGLTMEGQQAERTLEAIHSIQPEAVVDVKRLYNWHDNGSPEYSPRKGYQARVLRTVRELCTKHELTDRIPRHIEPGPLSDNKRIAEALFLKAFDLELQEANEHRVWAYRRAAWAVDEWPQNVAILHAAGGESALRALPAVGETLAREIVAFLRRGPPQSLDADPPAAQRT